MCMKNCKSWLFGHKLGIFLVLMYLVCFAWYFVHPVEQEMHLAMLRMSFFGFTSMNFVSFLFGLVQVYIWGYVAVLLWHLTMLLGGCGMKDKCKGGECKGGCCEKK